MIWSFGEIVGERNAHCCSCNYLYCIPQKTRVLRVNFQTRQCLVKIAIMTALASPKDDDQFTPTLLWVKLVPNAIGLSYT